MPCLPESKAQYITQAFKLFCFCVSYSMACLKILRKSTGLSDVFAACSRAANFEGCQAITLGLFIPAVISVLRAVFHMQVKIDLNQSHTFNRIFHGAKFRAHLQVRWAIFSPYSIQAANQRYCNRKHLRAVLSLPFLQQIPSGTCLRRSRFFVVWCSFPSQDSQRRQSNLSRCWAWLF